MKSYVICKSCAKSEFDTMVQCYWNVKKLTNISLDLSLSPKTAEVLEVAQQTLLNLLLYFQVAKIHCNLISRKAKTGILSPSSIGSNHNFTLS